MGQRICVKEMWARGKHTGSTGGRSSPAAVPSSPWLTWAHSSEEKMENLYQDGKCSPPAVLLLPAPLLSKTTTLHQAALLVCCQDTRLLKVSVEKALLKHLFVLQSKPRRAQKQREPETLERACFSSRKISARTFEYERLWLEQRKNVQRAPEIGHRTGPVAWGFCR